MTQSFDRPSRRAFLELSASISGLATLSGCVRSSEGAAKTETPRLIAHRGCAANHPENTLTAVSAAADVADAIEVDVRQCASGDLIVFHDATLDELTNKSGPVRTRNCGEVLDAEVLHSGETIPTLKEVFEAIPPDVGVVLDLKEYGLSAQLLDVVEAYEHAVVISSFHEEILEEFRYRDIRTAYIVRGSNENRDSHPLPADTPYCSRAISSMIRKAVQLNCLAIFPRYELCFRTDLLAKAHRAGLLVTPWTVTSRRLATKLARIGVDGIISDICYDLFRGKGAAGSRSRGRR